MMHTALMLEPLNASFHFYTGTFLLADGEYAEAQRETERAIELQPGADGFSAQLAFALIGQGRTDRAIAAANADPNAGDRLQALAITWHARGDKSKAREALDAMIRGQGRIAPRRRRNRCTSKHTAGMRHTLWRLPCPTGILGPIADE